MVILMVKALVVAVLELPNELVRTLHWSQAGTYICSPVLVPHITGGAEILVDEFTNLEKSDRPFPQGLETANVSVWHWPRLLPEPAATEDGPIVRVVTGLLRANVSKSSLTLCRVTYKLSTVPTTLVDTQKMNSEKRKRNTLSSGMLCNLHLAHGEGAGGAECPVRGEEVGAVLRGAGATGVLKDTTHSKGLGTRSTGTSTEFTMVKQRF